MKLTINIATRGRPELLLETVRQTVPNISRDDTRLLISVDDDDGATLDCLNRLPRDDRITVSVEPREDSRGEKYDRALKFAKADIYLPAVDCAPIITPAFDQAIINAARLFPDGIGCVYTPMANASFPSLQAITAKMAEKLGGIYNRDYPFWFIDHELDDIARMIGRFTFVDVHVATAPYRPAKTIRLRDLAFWTIFFDAATLERRAKARAIIDAVDFEEAQWRKAIMREQYQIVEARSRWINWSVRNEAAAIEAARGEQGPPDVGYLRAKLRAEQKLQALIAGLEAQEVAQTSAVSRLVIRPDVDVHGVRQDWLWPVGDHWGWEHPYQTWPAIKALLAHCPQRRVVVQAGGCCGMYPALLAKEFETVYTAEMDPVNFECLSKNCPANVNVIHAALGDRKAVVGIDHRSESNCGNHHVDERPGDVRMLRIDDLGLEVCDAIMLDAEAYETKIITGALDTIRRCKPALITAETISDEMVAMLKAEGYELAPQAAHDRHFLRREAAAQAA